MTCRLIRTFCCLASVHLEEKFVRPNQSQRWITSITLKGFHNHNTNTYDNSGMTTLPPARYMFLTIKLMCTISLIGKSSWWIESLSY